jgi:hypothetical protein
LEEALRTGINLRWMAKGYNGRHRFRIPVRVVGVFSGCLGDVARELMTVDKLDVNVSGLRPRHMMVLKSEAAGASRFAGTTGGGW